MIRNKLIYLFIFVFITGAAGIKADDRGNLGSVKIVSPQREATPADQDMATARQLMARGAFLSAVDFIEDLVAKYPDDPRAADLLMSCYLELKAYDRAESYIKGRIENNPTNLKYYVTLMSLYIKTGNDSSLTQTVEDAIGLFPGEQGIYGTLIRILLDYNRPDIAMGLIQKARSQFALNDLFGFEAGEIYEVRMDYGRAVYEYLRAAEKDSVSAETADRKLALLVRYPGAAPKAIAALNQYLDSLPDNTIALRTLLEAYSLNGQYSDAFHVCIRLDSLGDGEGRELFAYIRQCRERKLYAEVIATGDYMVAKKIRNSSFSQAQFYYAEALTALGQINRALEQYRELASHVEVRRDRAEALLRIGDIYREILNNFDSARVYYMLVNQEYQISQYNNPAGLALAQMLLIEGHLDRAEESYRKMKQRNLLPAEAEEVSYILAQIKFFRKDYADAEFAMRKHIEEFPQGFRVNDALIHTLIIGENAIASPGALDKYAEAEFYQMRRLPDSMSACLTEIRNMSYSALYGLSGLKLAENMVARGDTAAAFGIVEEMAGKYDYDYFYPYCLKLKADLLAVSEINKEAAIRIYHTLLSEYAAYPFVGEVRRSLQLLEGYLRPEERT
jgi:tetratricopeptide (TPR) repeat protein